MRKTVLSLSVALLILASVEILNAASLAGANLPDTAVVAGKSLVLNGLGLRTEFMVKVYIAGLYLEQKSADPEAIIKADAPKRLVMQFLHDASNKQMTDAFSEWFHDNTPEAGTTMKADIDRFLGVLEPVKVGDQMVFTYLPATGTTVTINGKDKLTIAGPRLQPGALLGVAGAETSHGKSKKGDSGTEKLAPSDSSAWPSQGPGAKRNQKS